MNDAKAYMLKSALRSVCDELTRQFNELRENWDPVDLCQNRRPVERILEHSGRLQHRILHDALQPSIRDFSALMTLALARQLSSERLDLVRQRLSVALDLLLNGTRLYGEISELSRRIGEFVAQQTL